MRILPMSNYQTQVQNRNQAQNTSPNFKGYTKLAESLHLPPRFFRGIMKDAIGNSVIIFEHPFSGRTYKALLSDPKSSDKIVAQIASTEAPCVNVDLTKDITRISETTSADDRILWA